MIECIQARAVWGESRVEDGNFGALDTPETFTQHTLHGSRRRQYATITHGYHSHPEHDKGLALLTAVFGPELAASFPPSSFPTNHPKSRDHAQQQSPPVQQRD